MTKKNAQKLNRLMCNMNPGHECRQKAIITDIDGRKMQCMFFDCFIIGLYEPSEYIETAESPKLDAMIKKYLTTKLPDEYDQISFRLDDIVKAQDEYKNRERTVSDPKKLIVWLHRKLFDAEWVRLILKTLKTRDEIFWWCSTPEYSQPDYIASEKGIALLCPARRDLEDSAVRVPVEIICKVRK